jgi:hypothetical protein
MALKNHELMLQIGKVLDDNIGIRMKARLSEADYQALDKNQAELIRLGRQLEKSEKMIVKNNGELATNEDIERAMKCGCSNLEIAKNLHVGRERVRRIRAGLELCKLRSKDTKYEIYRGEKLVCSGTARWCATVLKMTPGCVCWLTSPAAQRHFKKSRQKDKCLIGFCREAKLEANA